MQAMIYAKTALGLDVLKTRSGGLGARMRAILVVIDGETPQANCSSRQRATGDKEGALEELLRFGLIAPIGEATQEATQNECQGFR